MRIGVFHPGTQHSWQTALAFQESGQLAWYATSAFYDPARWPYKVERFLPRAPAARLNREFRRRHHPALDPALVRQFGFDEWAETAARRLRFSALAAALNRRGNRRFGHALAHLAAREPVDVLWGFNTSSLEAFRWAKLRGIRCVLDQTIGHPRAFNRVMEAEHAVHPGYFEGGPPVIGKDAIARQDEEVALADLVVCGSEFCAATMIENGCPAEKLRIVPYGFDESLFPDTPPLRAPLEGRPVNFLFVGEVGPRKGVPYLLEAFAAIPPADATLTLIGRRAIPEAALRPFMGRVTHIGQLPRSEVAAHFRAADCFIFPSLFEGGGIVLYEAAAAGLGVVQSHFCGDGVRGDRNGISLDTVTFATVIAAARRVVADPSMLCLWQEASWRMRKERSWSVYRRSVRELAGQ